LIPSKLGSPVQLSCDSFFLYTYSNSRRSALATLSNLVALVVTRSAYPATGHVDNEVSALKQMAIQAFRLANIDRCRRIAAQEILSRSYLLKMIWPYTAGPPASVVNFHAGYQ
jgi:hypothetical protein